MIGWYSNYVVCMMNKLVNEPHKIALVKSTYSPNLDAHQNINDIPPSAICATQDLTGVSISSAGVLHANKPTFTGVPKGIDNIVGYVIYNCNTGDLVLADTEVDGACIRTNGGEIELCFDECGVAAL